MIRSTGWLVALVLTCASAFSQQAVSPVPRKSSPFVRWGVRIYTGSSLELTRIDVNWNTTSTNFVGVPPGSPGLVQFRDTPSTSPDDFRAAIPVPTSLGGTIVYVIRNIRAATPGQTTGYWLPIHDPTDSQYHILGPPRFFNSEELWVLEGLKATNRVSRLARYRLDPTSAVFLGSCDLDDPLYPNESCAYYDWLIHDGTAVLLQQRESSNGIGIDVLRYRSDGSVAHRFPVNGQGFAFYQMGIDGIRSVPAHPDWGFMQYSVGYPGRTQAQFIDLNSGALTGALSVQTPASEGRISSDGKLALFRHPDGNSKLLPVRLPALIIQGQPLDVLPAVDAFFCQDAGDSVAMDDGSIVTGPSSTNCSGNRVHRTRLTPTGQLEITSISVSTGPATGNQPFLLSGSLSGGAADSPRFVYPIKNRLYNLSGSSGQSLLYLDVTTMTYASGVFVPPLLCRVLF